ncbi:MAG: RnfABCDGE type electron transport complex subunit B [Clostridium sp.]|uniref:RnfABCDGE type electron transport complex subunit B n=1 Tax=Clostridium sp. TaxID=1506 RepID=UPI003F3E6803
MNILYAGLSLGALGLIFGILLGFASKKFTVKVDPKVPKLREALPGANCGGCGYPGCNAYANALVLENAKGNLCTVGGEKVLKEISNILGTKEEMSEKKVAFVKCNGNCENAKENFIYDGIKDCNEAHNLSTKGSKSCTYGCLGLGSCVRVCEFDALEIIDGIAKVNEEKCTNCGACQKICPKGLIEDVELEKKVRVSCNSKDKGKDVRENCKVGCIGCTLCQKACPKDAIEIKDSLARVVYDKCVGCKLCTKKCPTGAIKVQ